jgi:hypothetical protein
MNNVTQFKQPRFIDLVNGDDCEILERWASTAMKGFDDGKLIENLQNDPDHELYDLLYTCVNATFQRARAFNELKKERQAATIH